MADKPIRLLGLGLYGPESAKATIYQITIAIRSADGDTILASRSTRRTLPGGFATLIRVDFDAASSAVLALKADERYMLSSQISVRSTKVLLLLPPPSILMSAAVDEHSIGTGG